jgi:predicted anti-sigma-YlaC factor YlaD
MAGHDLPRSEEAEVERHLVECVDCRRHWAALGQSQYVLEQARVL